MRVAVVGSRGFNDMAYLEATLSGYPITHIVSGGAIGADTLAVEYAKKHKIPFTEHKPKYEQYGKSAPLLRNVIIVEDCEAVIAFWDGVSRGTKHTIDQARRTDRSVFIVYTKNVTQ